MGGSFSSVRFPFEKSCLLASFTRKQSQLLLYMMTVQRSIRSMRMESCEMRSGSSERARSVSVNCGYGSNAAHAVFFHIPRKDYVVSQHVKLWNRGRAKHFRGPS